MVATEGYDAFDTRGSYTFEATSSRSIRIYDTSKPETFETWWHSHGQAALDREGLLLTVTEGKPTYDDAAEVAVDREMREGTPDDPEQAAYDIYLQMIDSYYTKNRAAYSLLVGMVVHRSGRMQSILRDEFSQTRDGHVYVKFLRAEASPLSEERQQQIRLTLLTIQKLAADPNEPLPFSSSSPSREEILSYVDHHAEAFLNIAGNSIATDPKQFIDDLLKILRRVATLAPFCTDAILRRTNELSLFYKLPADGTPTM
jgi:hypothetical protein